MDTIVRVALGFALSAIVAVACGFVTYLAVDSNLLATLVAVLSGVLNLYLILSDSITV